MTLQCTHPDHNDQTNCQERAVGCSPHCECCMGELTTPQPTYTVEQVHSLLERQPFADYYSGHFEDYITGGDGTKSLDEMKATSLAKLAELLKDFGSR